MPRTVYVLALASAFCSACATIFIRQGLRGRGPYTGFWINLVVGTVGLWAAVLLTGGFGRLSATGIAFFVLAGLIGTVAGRLLRFVSIEKVGASTAAALINLHPLFATGVAILLLGERVTAPILAGTVVIVLGTILLSIGGRRGGIRPWQITLPLLSAACFGVVAVLRKLGLAETGAVLGSAINVTTALVAFTAFLLASGDWEASVVAPLYGTAPIFVLFLSFFFLRGVETLSGRLVLGTLLIVLGVYLITALSER